MTPLLALGFSSAKAGQAFVEHAALSKLNVLDALAIPVLACYMHQHAQLSVHFWLQLCWTSCQGLVASWFFFANQL